MNLPSVIWILLIRNSSLLATTIIQLTHFKLLLKRGLEITWVLLLLFFGCRSYNSVLYKAMIALHSGLGCLADPISCTSVDNVYAAQWKHGREAEADALLTYPDTVALDFTDSELTLELQDKHFSTYQWRGYGRGKKSCTNQPFNL